MSARRAVRWTTHLRRRTTTGDWLPEIDGLRFVAIASVLVLHLQGQIENHYTRAVHPSCAWLVRAFDFGYRGVPLFFVLSGFILALPFARHYLFNTPTPSLRRYLLRRVTRLEPPYLLNLVLAAIGAAIANQTPWHLLLPHLAASAAYLHYAIFRTPSTINAVAWSLEVEVQFYLLAPLLTTIFALRSAGWRRLTLLFAMLASAGLQAVFHLSQFTLAGDLQYFLAGLLLADFYLTGAPALSCLSRSAWDVLSLAGWPAFFLVSDRWVGTWLPALALLLCLAALRGNRISRLLRSPAIAITGGMCYTIYLWHAPVLTVVDRTLRTHLHLLPTGYLSLFLVEAFIKVTAVALVCLPLFVLVERPCMDPKWPRKLAARLRWDRQPASLLAATDRAR